MVDFVSKLRYDVYDLQKLMNFLCSPGGCQWDREQTHDSIQRNLLEEAYETVEAINSGSTDDLAEELGDVLMQVVFHADIAERAGNFTLDDIADITCKKLIRRHPHVFGDANVENSDEVLVQWDDIKRQERHQETASDAMLSVAQSLPALWRAEKIQGKAAKIGFDWPDYTGALDALRAELAELECAIESCSGIEEELGDIFFSAVNIARFFRIDPEDALSAASDKFISRFSRMEDMASKLGISLKDMSLDEMEELYQKVKLER